MADTANGQTITLNILIPDTDPNKTIMGNTAVAYPASPLSPNTTYRVNHIGTIGGATFSRSFTFATGGPLA